MLFILRATEYFIVLKKLFLNFLFKIVAGWTPLHAAACCGNVDLVEYLCTEGADISVTNSDKELAVDLAEEDDCRLSLEEEHQRQGIDPDECRNRFPFYNS